MTIAWYDPTNHHVSTDKHDPLFTSLGQLLPLDVPREWVGLTDKEMQAVVDAQLLVSNINVYFKAIEAKLKEKNNAT